MSHQPVVLVCGVRTPFAKAFEEYEQYTAIDLGVAAVRGLLQRTSLDPQHIDQLIMGNVVTQSSVTNLAREVVLSLQLKESTTAHTLSMACASGLLAVMQGVMTIETGQANCIICGGSDSTSSAELPLPQHITAALSAYRSRKVGLFGLARRLGPPSSWIPKVPSIAERSTGHTMGWHADVSAEKHGVTRAEQDAWAIRSHAKAWAAQQAGLLADEVVPVTLPGGKTLSADPLIRQDVPCHKVSALPTVFRKGEAATVTAASSSPLTDGASCVLVMSRFKALELGYPVDITVRSWATCGIDPTVDLLLAPIAGIKEVLRKSKLTWANIDIVEIHEAFAAQVLCTLRHFTSAECVEEFGVLDVEAKVNLEGGSISIGHPFAATGGRLIAHTINSLRQRQARIALISACAAGGLGLVMILQRTPDVHISSKL